MGNGFSAMLAGLSQSYGEASLKDMQRKQEEAFTLKKAQIQALFDKSSELYKAGNKAGGELFLKAALDSLQPQTGGKQKGRQKAEAGQGGLHPVLAVTRVLGALTGRRRDNIPPGGDMGTAGGISNEELARAGGYDPMEQFKQQEKIKSEEKLTEFKEEKKYEQNLLNEQQKHNIQMMVDAGMDPKQATELEVMKGYPPMARAIQRVPVTLNGKQAFADFDPTSGKYFDPATRADISEQVKPPMGKSALDKWLEAAEAKKGSALTPDETQREMLRFTGATQGTRTRASVIAPDPGTVDYWADQVASGRVPITSVPGGVQGTYKNQVAQRLQQTGRIIPERTPAAMQNRIAQAKVVLTRLDEIERDLQAVESQVGPVTGRFYKGLVLVGNAPQPVAKLDADLRSFASLLPILHGYRGGATVQKVFEDELIGTIAQSPEQLRGRLSSQRELATDITSQGPLGNATPTGTIPTVTTPGHRVVNGIDQYD
jgi:hypothetical protein